MTDITSQFILFFNGLDSFWFYLSVFFIAFIENLFPPSPSDVLLVFIGSLIVSKNIHFPLLLLLSTFGSTLGFMSMFYIGKLAGQKALNIKWFPFIKKEPIEKGKKLINKYGYGIVVINRFLSGTRAILSFIIGTGNLNPIAVSILCFLSALIWNFLMLMGGKWLGNNWQEIYKILTNYSTYCNYLFWYFDFFL